ncbi:hypothetical protein IU459_31810 [Nocardia amamiensis]|uniref:DUF222 domain-containing protein n=1 Tax=Nocardia amamiensis TaxID=404578 RepID=A0ABS0D0C1_9NOCA|nr:hypothetical protein [Nocardia amamiensis]MBF6302096.1 hypothetical protein [Nocardia amamiensis]
MDERIEAWARETPAAERTSGPTIEDLGGLEEIVAQADYFITGPFLGYLVTAAGRDTDIGLTPALADTIVAGLATSTRHAAFAEAADSLAARPHLARLLGKPVTRALLARITAAGEVTEDPAIALIGAESAECLLQLSLAKVTTVAQLAGKLDEVTEDVAALPEEFAVRIPRLLGVLDAHLPGVGMRQALERCLPYGHTFRDAAFELALSDLRSALEQHDYQAIAARMSDVRSQLLVLTETDSGRLDATIYLAAIEGLLGLSAPDARSGSRQQQLSCTRTSSGIGHGECGPIPRRGVAHVRTILRHGQSSLPCWTMLHGTWGGTTPGTTTDTPF